MNDPHDNAETDKQMVSKLLYVDAETYTRKAADYASGDDPWENFRFSAGFAARVCRGLPEDDLRRATVLLMGVKISRLMTLGLKGTAANEKVIETLGDLRVYTAILEAQHAS